MVKHECVYNDFARACKRTRRVPGLARKDPRCRRVLGICMKRRRWNANEAAAYVADRDVLVRLERGRTGRSTMPPVEEPRRAPYVRPIAPTEPPMPKTHCRLFRGGRSSARRCEFVAPVHSYDHEHVDSGCAVQHGVCKLDSGAPRAKRPAVEKRAPAKFGPVRSHADVERERAMRSHATRKTKKTAK